MSAHKYSTQQDETDGKVRYFFYSIGPAIITKSIEYSPLQILNGRMVYNLGFGDYDISTNNVDDKGIRNNGDAFKVFNTVLSTIPVFFNGHPHDVVLVQGSDSTEEFITGCKLSCKKKCTNICKNANRRISNYRNYVNRHFDDLSINYSFFGGFNKGQRQGLHQYSPGEEYDFILVLKK